MCTNCCVVQNKVYVFDQPHFDTREAGTIEKERERELHLHLKYAQRFSLEAILKYENLREEEILRLLNAAKNTSETLFNQVLLNLTIVDSPDVMAMIEATVPDIAPGPPPVKGSKDPRAEAKAARAEAIAACKQQVYEDFDGTNGVTESVTADDGIVEEKEGEESNSGAVEESHVYHNRYLRSEHINLLEFNATEYQGSNRTALLKDLREELRLKHAELKVKQQSLLEELRGKQELWALKKVELNAAIQRNDENALEGNEATTHLTHGRGRKQPQEESLLAQKMMKKGELEQKRAQEMATLKLNRYTSMLKKIYQAALKQCDKIKLPKRPKQPKPKILKALKPVKLPKYR